MSDTNNKSEKSNPVAAYEVVQVQNDKLKLIEGRYALSKKELNNLDGMILSTEKYEIIRDEKTGKIVRVQDNRAINEIIDDNNHRKIRESLNKKEQNEKSDR